MNTVVLGLVVKNRDLQAGVSVAGGRVVIAVVAVTTAATVVAIVGVTITAALERVFQAIVVA